MTEGDVERAVRIEARQRRIQCCRENIVAVAGEQDLVVGGDQHRVGVVVAAIIDDRDPVAGESRIQRTIGVQADDDDISIPGAGYWWSDVADDYDLSISL